MKIKCAFSGVPLQIPEFKGVNCVDRNSQVIHPIFYLSYKDLFKLHTSFTQGHTTEIEQILLFLALFNKTGLLEIAETVDALSVAINYKTLQSVKFCLWKLPEVCKYLSSCNSELFNQMPKIAITEESKTLTNCANWVSLIEDAVNDATAGYIQIARQKTKAIQEEIIELAIHTQSKAGSYIKHLLSWLDSEIVLGYEQLDLLKLCATASIHKIYGIPLDDLQELQKYLYLKLENSSIHSEAVFALVRSAIAKQTDVLGLNESFELLVTETALSSTAPKIDLKELLAKAKSKALGYKIVSKRG